MCTGKDESYPADEGVGGDHSLLTSGTKISLNCGLQVSVLEETFKILPAEHTEDTPT